MECCYQVQNGSEKERRRKRLRLKWSSDYKERKPSGYIRQMNLMIPRRTWRVSPQNLQGCKISGTNLDRECASVGTRAINRLGRLSFSLRSTTYDHISFTFLCSALHCPKLLMKDELEFLLLSKFVWDENFVKTKIQSFVRHSTLTLCISEQAGQGNFS